MRQGHSLHDILSRGTKTLNTRYAVALVSDMSSCSQLGCQVGGDVAYMRSSQLCDHVSKALLYASQ